MTEIIRSADCGNSPKNLFLEQLAIAFAHRDVEYLLACVTDDIQWTRAGNDQISGKSAFAAALEHLKFDPITHLVITHVLTHGKAGAVNGTAVHSDGALFDFCDIVEFASVKGEKVRSIFSYAIERVDQVYSRF